MCLQIFDRFNKWNGKAVMLKWVNIITYKDKQFSCGWNILTKGAFVTQLSNNVESQFDKVCELWKTAISWVIYNKFFLLQI
jgi:hypothetical protein